MGILQDIVAFIVALGVLVTFHEFGHFWLARRCDVKILRFSIGFGRAVWKRTFGKDNTELVIAALPLGGYVKMLDEREGEVAAAEKHRAFNNKPLSRRFMIVAAGPVFNFLFAILAYWIMYMVGMTGMRPVIGEIDEGSIALQAGLKPGQEIVSIDNVPTPTWSKVIDITINNIIKGESSVFTVRDNDGVENEITVNLGRISIDNMASGKLLESLGVTPLRPVYPAVIGKLTAGGEAEKAGLLPGDRVVAVDGRNIAGWEEWVEVIQGHPRQSLSVELMRNNERITITVTPDLIETEAGKKIGRIGATVDDNIAMDESLLARERYGPVLALIKGVDKTLEMSVMTLRILGKMISGEASVKNLSGPISIAQYAGQTAGLGLVAFLGFMAIVSVSLGVLNLLPIPLLDGGHLLYYLIELLKGSPISDSTQMVGQQLGIALLLCLMSIAFYNDLIRLIG